MKEIYDVISSPLITEKGTMVNEEANQFVFRVRREFNKQEIRRAVETLFKVQRRESAHRELSGQDPSGRANGRPQAAWKRPTSPSPDSGSICRHTVRVKGMPIRQYRRPRTGHRSRRCRLRRPDQEEAGARLLGRAA